MPYARAKYAFGFCDRTGVRYPLKDLVWEYKDGHRTGMRIGKDVVDPDHPQNFLGRVRVVDPQSLRDPRPDTGLEASREIPASAQLVEPNLIANGGFSQGAAAWTEYNPANGIFVALANVSAGLARYSSGEHGAYQKVAVRTGTSYRVGGDLSGVSAGLRQIQVLADGVFPGAVLASTELTATSGPISAEFASGTNQWVYVYLTGTPGSAGIYDNIYLKQLSEFV